MKSRRCRGRSDLDFIFLPVQDAPNLPPRQIFATINGTAQEFQAFMQAMEKAMSGGPVVLEMTASSGWCKYRIVMDRLGPATPQAS